jgi:DNA-binding MarR family transcriptional regulator/GNAT superfamily N-acetyltransferase
MGAIESLRQFNRFYTRQLGLLDERLTRSPYSLTEARVLYELAHRASPTAATIARDLDLDTAYLSRILKRFKALGLIESAPNPAHAKQNLLSLTPAGRDAFAALDQAAIEQVSGLLAPLSEASRQRLVAAAGAIEAALAAKPQQDQPFTLRAPRVGDLGFIIHRQAVLYAEEYGWDWTYESLVAQILSDFVNHFNEKREAAWVAERAGAVVGSVFLVQGPDDAATGKLRLLYVEPTARRLGVGAALVDACIAKAREVGYSKLTLWTNDILVSARRIYQARGFELVKEEPHHSFGKSLVGQTWTLDL